MNQTVLWQMPVCSSGFADMGFKELPGRLCVLFAVDSEDDDENKSPVRIFFEDVQSYKCTYYNALTLEMLDAYDKIVEINDSAWLKDTVEQVNRKNYSEKIINLHHLRICFDDGPCYEFICRDCYVEAAGYQTNYVLRKPM